MAHPMMSAAKSSAARRMKMLGGKSPDKKAYAGVDAGYYACGGSVMHEETKVPGKKPKDRADRYARGGAVKGKKGTQVNVIIAQGAPPTPGDAKAMPVPVPVGGGAPAPAPKPAMPMPAGAMPPAAMMPRASGGRVGFKRGGMVKHEDEEDKKLLSSMIKKAEKKETKAEKSERKHEKRIGLKTGGVVPMTAGACDGEGRLEKAKMAKKK